MAMRWLEELSVAYRRELRSFAAREHGAERRVPLPHQRTVTWGTVWAAGHGLHSADADHVQWGRVLTYREVLLGRLLAGDSAREMQAYHEHLVRRYDRGWRLSEVRCECVHGEPVLASIHRTNVWPITWLEYGYALDHGFCQPDYLMEDWYMAMLSRITGEHEEGRGIQ